MDSIPNKYLQIGSVAVLILGLAWIGVSSTLPGTASVSGIPAPQEGFLAPDFTLPDQNGVDMTLSDFQGQAVLVNIWASWCSPCKQEMPAMQQIYQDYQDRGFTILAVNAANQDSRADAEAFVQEMGLTFPILFDQNGQVSELYQVRALPSSFFILPDGTIQEVVIGGPMAEALLYTRVENLLAEVD
jgi:cytochrome c biogenesis protein CcmG/thiol:disulfide interchange protein DsbE